MFEVAIVTLVHYHFKIYIFVFIIVKVKQAVNFTLSNNIFIT